MNFNPYAFVSPSNRAEYIELLDEAVMMAEELSELWDQVFDASKGEEE